MFEELKYLLNCEKGNKKITLTVDIADNINKVIYGDKEKIKQTVVYMFSYISNIIKNGNIHITVDNMNVGRFCRLKFHFYVDSLLMKDYIKENSSDKVIVLRDNNDNLDYVSIMKLLELQRGKIDVKTNNNVTELILMIDQRIMSEYEVIDNREENANIKVKYFDASDKRILLVDDSRQKLKDLIVMLKPYGINVETANNDEDMFKKLAKDKTYDLILIDDIIPKFNNLFNDKIEKKFNIVDNVSKSARYEIPIVIMVTPNNEKYEDDYIKLGFNDYIMKPVNKSDLNRILSCFLKINKNNEK